MNEDVRVPDGIARIVRNSEVSTLSGNAGKFIKMREVCLWEVESAYGVPSVSQEATYLSSQASRGSCYKDCWCRSYVIATPPVPVVFS